MPTTWKEQYKCDGDPQTFATELLSKFNTTLRTGEKARELVGVRVLEDEPTVLDHVWSKENLFTVENRGRYYDVMRCKRCGITGKRFGLSGSVRRDSKYRAKKYEKCRAALESAKGERP